MKSPHTSLLSLETQHGLADMVASGKTHNIIGTKLWNMQYGGWLLYFVPGRVLWSESVHRGTFDFCSCVRDSMLTGSLLWADWAAGGAAGTQRWSCFGLMWLQTASPVCDHQGAAERPGHQVRGRGLKERGTFIFPDKDIQLFDCFLVDESKAKFSNVNAKVLEPSPKSHVTTEVQTAGHRCQVCWESVNIQSGSHTESLWVQIWEPAEIPASHHVTSCLWRASSKTSASWITSQRRLQTQISREVNYDSQDASHWRPIKVFHINSKLKTKNIVFSFPFRMNSVTMTTDRWQTDCLSHFELL